MLLERYSQNFLGVDLRLRCWAYKLISTWESRFGFATNIVDIREKVWLKRQYKFHHSGKALEQRVRRTFVPTIELRCGVSHHTIIVKKYFRKCH